MNFNLHQILNHLDSNFADSIQFESTHYNNEVIDHPSVGSYDKHDSSFDANDYGQNAIDHDQSHPPYDHPRFEIVKWLARGSFGEVWEGCDKKLHRKVAVKCFFGTHRDAMLAFKNETKYLQFLEHPGIPAVLDVSSDEVEYPYLVMQYIDGITLRDIINQLKQGDEETHKEFTFARRVDIIIQILRILSQVHSDGIIHRDIKPANIMIGHTGEIYLMDWGLAIHYQRDDTSESINGTPLYMSPEQYLLEPITPKSDLYALAAVAYELLSLHTTVSKEGNVYSLAMSIIDGDFKQFSHVYNHHQGHAPSEFEVPIMQALAREPSHRPSNAQTMKVMLERALAGYFQVICTRTRLKKAIFSFFPFSIPVEP